MTCASVASRLRGARYSSGVWVAWLASLAIAAAIPAARKIARVIALS